MTPTRANRVEHRCWLGEVRALVDAVDQAVYDTVAGTPTPRLDRQLVGVSTAANYSRLWLVTAAAVAVVGGAPGRRAARQGVLAVALTSAVTNAASAFAFASAVGRAAPGVRLPLRVAAATVAYSRVHTGVHYPSDVVIGAAVGELCGRAVSRWATRPAGAPHRGGDHDGKRR